MTRWVYKSQRVRQRRTFAPLAPAPSVQAAPIPSAGLPSRPTIIRLPPPPKPVGGLKPGGGAGPNFWRTIALQRLAAFRRTHELPHVLEPIVEPAPIPRATGSPKGSNWLAGSLEGDNALGGSVKGGTW